MSHIQNMLRLKAVADVLHDWKDQIVFVGGATTSLYVSSPKAIEVRTTDDVDIVIELVSLDAYYKMQDKLIEMGFKNDTEASIISRFIYQGIKVDFMPTEPDVLGFSNIWYKPGIENAVHVELDDGQNIQIFTTPYFLASKMEAFKGRGKGDFYASHDLEDIVFVLDNKDDVSTDLNQAPEDASRYLRNEFQQLLEKPSFKESLYGHVEQLDQTKRVKRILEILQDFCNS